MLLAYQNLACPSPKAPKQAPATVVTLLPLDGYNHSSATSSDNNDLTIGGFAPMLKANHTRPPGAQTARAGTFF